MWQRIKIYGIALLTAFTSEQGGGAGSVHPMQALPVYKEEIWL